MPYLRALAIKTHKSETLKEKIVNLFKFLLFLALGLGLFWLAYKDMQWQEIREGLRGVDYTWVGVSFGLGMLSHVSRAMRWNILIETLGHKPRLANSFLSVMVMYLTNFAIPRMGEITRCTLMTRYEKVPFTKLLGTVFLERIVDLVSLLLLGLVMATQLHVVRDFVEANPGVRDSIDGLMGSTALLAALLLGAGALVGALWFMRHLFRHLGVYQKLKGLLVQFWEGLLTIWRMERKLAFLAHSVFIFVIYYLSLYAMFSSFEATEHLGWLAGLTVFVMSSFGMVAPVSGGMGAWHFMCIGTMVLYQVGSFDARIFALVAHGSTSILMIVVGAVALLVLPVYNARTRPAQEAGAPLAD